MKFTPVRGGVAIASRNPGPGRIEVEITDTGLGMTEEELARAFEPFAQGSHSNVGTQSFGGLGLGLAIVRDLVTRHGGTVDATSRGRGLGAAFRVSLPLASEAARAQ